jgi:hypothetical protein
MGSEAGKAQYQTRTICECIHARWRNWDLRQLTVRGINKDRAIVLWYALTNTSCRPIASSEFTAPAAA